MIKSHCRNVRSHNVEMSLLQVGCPLWILVYMRVDSSLVSSQVHLNLSKTKIDL